MRGLPKHIMEYARLFRRLRRYVRAPCFTSVTARRSTRHCRVWPAREG